MSSKVNFLKEPFRVSSYYIEPQDHSDWRNYQTFEAWYMDKEKENFICSFSMKDNANNDDFINILKYNRFEKAV